MSWLEIFKLAGIVGGILTSFGVPLLWAALKWWGSGVWAPISLRDKAATTSDLAGLSSRVNDLAQDYASTIALAEDNKDRLARLEQEQKHHQERIVEQIIKPLEQISDRLDNISRGQTDQAVVIGRLEEGMKGLGRSVDDLRARVERQEKNE